MPKILMLANDFTTIYHFRRELINELISRNYEVILSLPKHEQNTEFEKMGCKVKETDFSRSGKNPIKELALLSAYKKLIKRVAPDVVLTYTAKPNIYGGLACQSLNTPYICNITGLGTVFQSENLIKKIMILLQKKAYKKSKKVFFQNKVNKEYFEAKGIVKKNAGLIPGSGVNLKLNKLEPYPQNDEIVRFILVSRIRQDKGFDELFDSVKKITAETKNVEFHLAGWYEDESYKVKIDEMVRDYPVFFHGNQPQEKVHDLIAYCHCLVHPSYHEGMANVLLEAAAAGRPCLASNIPGCKEAVDNGITGFLFSVHSSESLEKAINKFIKLNNKQKEQMGAAGRIKVEKEFDRKIVIDAYMDEIKLALEQQK